MCNERSARIFVAVMKYMQTRTQRFAQKLVVCKWYCVTHTTKRRKTSSRSRMRTHRRPCSTCPDYDTHAHVDYTRRAWPYAPEETRAARDDARRLRACLNLAPTAMAAHTRPTGISIKLEACAISAPQATQPQDHAPKPLCP